MRQSTWSTEGLVYCKHYVLLLATIVSYLWSYFWGSAGHNLDFSQINKQSIFLYGQLCPVGIEKLIGFGMNMIRVEIYHLCFRNWINKNSLPLRALNPDITLADEEMYDSSLSLAMTWSPIHGVHKWPGDWKGHLSLSLLLLYIPFMNHGSLLLLILARRLRSDGSLLHYQSRGTVRLLDLSSNKKSHLQDMLTSSCVTRPL